MVCCFSPWDTFPVPPLVLAHFGGELPFGFIETEENNFLMSQACRILSSQSQICPQRACEWVWGPHTVPYGEEHRGTWFWLLAINQLGGQMLSCGL